MAPGIVPNQASSSSSPSSFISRSFQDLVTSRFIFFCYPLPLPLLSFPLSRVQGIFGWNSPLCVVGLGGIQRSLELGGPQAGAKQCVTARPWQGLQPWGVGSKRGPGGGRQRAAERLGACQRRPEAGAGRPFKLGKGILAGHFPSKLPGSLVGYPGLRGTNLAKNSPFFKKIFFTKLNNRETVSISIST